MIKEIETIEIGETEMTEIGEIEMTEIEETEMIETGEIEEIVGEREDEDNIMDLDCHHKCMHRHHQRQ